MKYISKIVYILIAQFFLISCTNYQNEMMNWAEKIPAGTILDSVKLHQPDYLTIDWNNPDTLDAIMRYNVIEIKRHKDLLKMQYFLEFENNKFRGLFGRK